jgi:hypothetical protein
MNSGDETWPIWSFLSGYPQGCQMVYFHTKISNNWDDGIFYGRKEYLLSFGIFTAIWYIYIFTDIWYI